MANERYQLLYGGNVISDTLMKEDYDIHNKEYVEGIIKELNSYDENTWKLQVGQIASLFLGLILGGVIGIIIGGNLL